MFTYLLVFRNKVIHIALKCIGSMLECSVILSNFNICWLNDVETSKVGLSHRVELPVNLPGFDYSD